MSYVLRVPRFACSPRDTARAGDLWRLVQEAAVLHSTDCGWSPGTYRATQSGFVVRELRSVHHREVGWGEDIPTTTWIGECRRDLLFRRDTRLGDVLSASADWVFIGPRGTPARAPALLVSNFGLEASEGVTLPAMEAVPPVPLPTWRFSPWWTEMDPQGHVNHPRYIDWGDEWVSRWMAGRGQDPIGIVPYAEQVRFRMGTRAGEGVVMNGALVGRAGDAAVFTIRMEREVPEGTSAPALLAEATLYRRHLSGVTAFFS